MDVRSYASNDTFELKGGQNEMSTDENAMHKFDFSVDIL